jgi:hypothetical protein
MAAEISFTGLPQNGQSGAGKGSEDSTGGDQRGLSYRAPRLLSNRAASPDRTSPGRLSLPRFVCRCGYISFFAESNEEDPRRRADLRRLFPPLPLLAIKNLPWIVIQKLITQNQRYPLNGIVQIIRIIYFIP